MSLCLVWPCQRTSAGCKACDPSAPFFIPTSQGPAVYAPQIGCICPPTSEQTCQNPRCGRKPPFTESAVARMDGSIVGHPVQDAPHREESDEEFLKRVLEFPHGRDLLPAEILDVMNRAEGPYLTILARRFIDPNIARLRITIADSK